jgi:septal ring factor EnvC (AmiA/AmiB activator)
MTWAAIAVAAALGTGGIVTTQQLQPVADAVQQIGHSLARMEDSMDKLRDQSAETAATVSAMSRQQADMDADLRKLERDLDYLSKVSSTCVVNIRTLRRIVESELDKEITLDSWPKKD